MSERTDTERLDWLESIKDPSWPLWGVEMHRGWLIALLLVGECAEDMFATGDTIREAINAAMDAEEQP